MREPFGVILAGGRGSRMGLTSKADLKLGEETLLARSAARLEPQCSGLVVVANTPVQTSLPVISDSLTGHLGPLAGVLAGLEYAAQQGQEHIVTVAVDTPFFPCDLAPSLLIAGLDGGNGFAVAATSDDVHGTFGVWPIRLIETLREFLQSGQRKVRMFSEQNSAATAMFPVTEPDSFFNINTPEQLEAAAKWL